MKTTSIATALIAFAALSSVSAFAMTHQYGEAALVAPPPTSMSTVTRASVQAEYLQARQNGTLPVSQEAAFAVAPAAVAYMTRAQVRDRAAMSTMKDGRSTL